MKTQFKSTIKEFEKYNGEVEILRQLTLDECDEECQPMFECRSGDFIIFEAFADELDAFPEYTNDYEN